jgi:hypothetical protein
LTSPTSAIEALRVAALVDQGGPDVPRGFDLDEETVERSMAQLSETFARNVGALADLFSRWRDPDVARKVIDSVIAGDGAAFRDLSELDLPISPLGKCIWLTELIEKVASVDTVTVCRKRDDLSPEEERRYIAIVLEFQRRGELPPMDSTGSPFINPVIPPGPFLRALKAENLVSCVEEQIGGGLKLAPARPKEFCF